MPANYLVKSTYDTVLKREPKPSSVLPPSYKIKFPKGQDLKALAVDTTLNAGHVRITFDPGALDADPDSVAKALKATGRNTFYLFHKHVEVDGTEPGNKPEDKPVIQLNVDTSDAGPLGYEFKLPGNRSPFYMNREVVTGCRILWAEALHYNGKTYRPPETVGVVDNVVRLCTFIRDVGRPTLAKHFGVSVADVAIQVNSFYRDPVTNRRVGGASRSRHCQGDGIDFVVYVKGKKISPYKINKICEPIARSCGLASASCFTHIDTRGYYSRWNYGF